jgi:hypothetical protein
MAGFATAEVRGHRDEARVRAGMEVLAVDEWAVLAITFQTPAMRVIAHRWTAGTEDFDIIVERRDGRRVELCQSGPGFGQVLATLSTIRVRRELGREEEQRLRATPSEEWAFLEIADEVEVAPARHRLAFTAAGAVLVLDGAVSFEADLDREPFDTLAAGCARLSSGNEAAPSE